MTAVRRMLAGVRRYPTVAVSLFIIILLIGISIYAMISLPLSEAIAKWNGSAAMWRYTPQCVPPTWTNLFRRENLPETIIVRTGDFETTAEGLRETTRRETTLLSFDYETVRFPSEAKIFYNIDYATKVPLVTLTWIKPDGSEIRLSHGTAPGGESRAELDLNEAFGEPLGVGSGTDPGFAVGDSETRAQKGTYYLRIEALVFETEGFSLDGQIVLYGGVYGMAGTDFRRRDLSIGLLWGTPIALMFGLIAATGTTLFAFIVAAIGAWYGGWLDATIQRLTEVSMMIPFLPTILMVGWFYSNDMWVLLGFIIGFSLFSGPLKSYRAMFLQAKQSQYIEAARAYGASNMRIIFRYLIPHMAPAILPRLIMGVPLFVFLEASLAVLGIADPDLPTWGKILSEAHTALYMGYYHWVLEPAFMLLLTGLSFSMLGYTLDRIFNPRLRNT
ncbi:MAG: ABC transporter permease [Candidatus Atribacteria bacterium]|nr:MAG: ABC transporter permease [Candidatus Atribacteria bacterium]